MDARKPSEDLIQKALDLVWEHRQRRLASAQVNTESRATGENRQDAA